MPEGFFLNHVRAKQPSTNDSLGWVYKYPNSPAPQIGLFWEGVLHHFPELPQDSAPVTHGSKGLANPCPWLPSLPNSPPHTLSLLLQNEPITLNPCLRIE